MKKFTIILLTVSCLSIGVLNTGCYGTFPLTKQIYKFNGSIGDKYVKQVVFWAFFIVPVYEVGTLADVIIFNLIEFWTGSNPLSMDKKTIKDGDNEYLLTSKDNKLTITQTSGANKGQTFEILLNKEQNTFYLLKGTEVRPLIKMVDEQTAYLYMPNGETKVVNPSMSNEYVKSMIGACN